VSVIRTVAGDIAAERFGVCDSHDHLFFRSELLPGQELDDVQAAEAEVRAFAGLGGQAIVQWTPFGLGRRADLLPGISRATGVHIVAATGLHQAAHYPPGVVDDIVGKLAELFISELTVGLRGDDGSVLDAKAGMIKVAGAFHGLDDHARTVMTAAAEASLATGASIGIHLEHGSAALDVLKLLCGDLAVPADRVILGHLNRFPDPYMLEEVAETGAFLAFDGPSRANQATDWRLIGALAECVAAGYGGQLLLGGDTTTVQARAATGGGPGLPYLLRSLRPRLTREIGAAAVHAILVANPARAFTIAG
jgi:5-phospho-D-xylono-1,4-lactonase